MDTYERIDKGIEAASDSVIPFQVTKDDEMAVVGDANKTEINKHDFKITFKIPSDNGYVTREKEFKGVFLKPRYESKVVKVVTELLPYFRKVKRDGSVSSYTEEEKLHIMETFSDEMLDLLYNLVEVVLGIDPEVGDYMTQTSVVTAAAQIIEMYPEMVNESDTFFG